MEIPHYIRKFAKKTIGKNERAYKWMQEAYKYMRYPGYAEEKRKLKMLIESFRTVKKQAAIGGITRLDFSSGVDAIEIRDAGCFAIDFNEPYPLPLGIYEETETVFLKEKLKGVKVAFDIGANFGWYSVFLSKLVGKNGIVYSFEPIPGVFSRLRKTIDLNHCTNVRLLNLALGEKEKEITLNVPEDLGSPFASEKVHGKPSRVKAVSLDGFVEKNRLKRVDFLKIDVEGGEMNVLKGAEKTIRKYKPSILIETGGIVEKFGYSPEQVLEVLRKEGYEIELVNGSNYMATCRRPQAKA